MYIQFLYFFLILLNKIFELLFQRFIYLLIINSTLMGTYQFKLNEFFRDFIVLRVLSGVFVFQAWKNVALQNCCKILVMSRFKLISFDEMVTVCHKWIMSLLKHLVRRLSRSWLWESIHLEELRSHFLDVHTFKDLCHFFFIYGFLWFTSDKLSNFSVDIVSLSSQYLLINFKVDWWGQSLGVLQFEVW